MSVRALSHGQAAKHRQTGLTLLEGIAFLAIAGLVMGGALAMYSSASTSQATGQVIAEFRGLRSGVKSLYPASAGYGISVLNGVLASAKMVPATLDASGLFFTNVWGGTVAILGQTSNFYVSASGVPQEVCIGMLSGITASNEWLGYNVVANALAVGAMTAITGQVDPATASAACATKKNRVTLWSA